MRVSIRICFYISRWSNVLIIEEIRLSRFLHHEIGIHDSSSCSQGTDLAPSVSQRNRLWYQQSKHHLHRQLRRYSTRTQSGASCPYKAHRYSISLHQKLRWRWNDTAGILSNGGYGGRRLNKSARTRKAQEIGKDDGNGRVAKVWGLRHHQNWWKEGGRRGRIKRFKSLSAIAGKIIRLRNKNDKRTSSSISSAIIDIFVFMQRWFQNFHY